MRTLAVKLTLGFLLVGVIGALLMAFFVLQRTRTEFNQFVLDRDRFSFVNTLAQNYQLHGGWEEVDAILSRGHFKAPGPIGRHLTFVLVDADGKVVSGTGRFKLGDKVRERDQRRGLPIEVDGEVVGKLIIDPSPNPPLPGSPEADFLTRTTRAILYSALGATGLALLLGILLARTISRPVRELTEATRLMAQGDLGHQVPVRTRDELGELTSSFNQMSADLAQLNQARRQMTADIAHELRTPLSVIMGYTEALSDGKLQGNPELYATIHKETQLLNHLIDDLRTLAMADTGELQLHLQPCDPKAILDRTAAAYKTQAENRGITLLAKADAGLPNVVADPERLAQVLGNLVTNALRYTQPDGQITLSAEQATGGGVNFKVKDTGSGIPDGDLPFIFERFYQGDKSRHKEEASGLGLAIAKSLVEMQGGTISVDSVLGQGTSFTITIPTG